MDHGLILSSCLGVFLLSSSFIRKHSLCAIVSDRLSAVMLFIVLSFNGSLLELWPMSSGSRLHKQQAFDL